MPKLTRDQIRPATDGDIGLRVLRDAPADATEIIEYVLSSSTLFLKLILISCAALSRFMALARTRTTVGVWMSVQQRTHGGLTG